MPKKKRKEGKLLKSSIENITKIFYCAKEGEKFYKELKKGFKLDNINEELEKLNARAAVFETRVSENISNILQGRR